MDSLHAQAVIQVVCGQLLHQVILTARRDHVHLEHGDMEQAQADLAGSWQLDPQHGTTGLLLAWVRLYQEEPDCAH